MSKFNEWQRNKQALNAAKSWVANRDKIDSQDNKRYTQKPMYNLQLEYCGQAYAGAKNYHESPSEFNVYLSRAFNELRTQIEDRALELLESDTNNAGALAKSEVEAMLSEINKNTGE